MASPTNGGAPSSSSSSSALFGRQRTWHHFKSPQLPSPAALSLLQKGFARRRKKKEKEKGDKEVAAAGADGGGANKTEAAVAAMEDSVGAGKVRNLPNLCKTFVHI